MRAFVPLVVLAAAAAPAFAEPEAPAEEGDRDYLAACLAAAGGRTAAARTTCFGQVSEVCLAQGAAETPDMLACAERELAAWQTLLDEALVRLQASEPPARLDAIARAQTVWRDWRASRCEVYATYDGPLDAPLAGVCRAETTSRRVVDLWEIEAGFAAD